MSFRYGFYNALNGDRKYDAEDFGRMFDGIINDGVFGTIGGGMITQAGQGLTVIVRSGKAWFEHTWNWLNSDLPVSIPTPNSVYTRIDAVVLEINSETRTNSIKVVQGAASPTPYKPVLYSYQHPLAYVTVPAGAEEIVQGNIEIAVGTSECPIVTGILQIINLDPVINSYKERWGVEFREWFEHLQDELDENQAAHLQHQIDDLDDKVDDAMEVFQYDNWKLGDTKTTLRPTLGDKWRLANDSYITSTECPDFVNYMVNDLNNQRRYYSEKTGSAEVFNRDEAGSKRRQRFALNKNRNEIYYVDGSNSYDTSTQPQFAKKIRCFVIGDDSITEDTSRIITISQNEVIQNIIYDSPSDSIVILSYAPAVYDSTLQVVIQEPHMYIRAFSASTFGLSWYLDQASPGTDEFLNFSSHSAYAQLFSNSRIVWPIGNTTVSGVSSFYFAVLDLSSHTIQRVAKSDRVYVQNPNPATFCSIGGKYILCGLSNEAHSFYDDVSYYYLIFDDEFRTIVEAPLVSVSDISLPLYNYIYGITVNAFHSVGNFVFIAPYYTYTEYSGTTYYGYSKVFGFKYNPDTFMLERVYSSPSVYPGLYTINLSAMADSESDCGLAQASYSDTYGQPVSIMSIVITDGVVESKPFTFTGGGNLYNAHTNGKKIYTVSTTSRTSPQKNLITVNEYNFDVMDVRLPSMPYHTSADYYTFVRVKE